MPELDFTGLNKIAHRGPQGPQDGPQAAQGIGTPPTEKTQPEATQRATAPKLQLEADHTAADNARSLEICQEYQRNIRLTEQLQADIAKGLLRGENIYSLFLKAVEALGLTVHDKGLLERTRSTVTAIYGYGLQEPQPLEMELTAINQRIDRMTAALARADLSGREQIERAIKAHRQQAEDVAAAINSRRGSGTE